MTKQNTLLRTKKLKIRITALLMTVIITALFMLTQFSSYADDYNECGKSVYWHFDESTGTLSIYVRLPYATGNIMQDFGDETSYSYYGGPWGLEAQQIKEVVIDSFVVNIGAYAFRNHTSLSKVYISDFVLSIGMCAFMNCSSLTNVNIPNSVTNIGKRAFTSCSSLANVNIPNSVTNIGDQAFAYCKSLPSVNIPNSVTNIGDQAFVGCPSLEKVTVDNDNLYYASRDGILYNKDMTVLIHYPQGNSRKTFTVPDFVTSIGDDAFYNCDTLTSITIPDSITSIGDDAFYDCDTLTSITIPDSVTSIGENAFQNCDNLTINCNENSYAHIYAIKNGLKYEFHKCVFTDFSPNNNATCTTDGTKTAVCTICDLAITVTDEGTATGHKWDNWITVTEPTDKTVVAEERKCSVCKVTERRDLPIIGELDNPFTDVKESAWFYDAVSYVVKKGYMNGMSATKFSPNSNITREQFVLILANIAGVDTNEFKPVSSGFKDVPTGKWYSGAVTWAVREGYVSGVSADKFGLGQSIQRAALARMLYNYASKNGIDVSGRADLSAFGDAAMFEKSGNAWMKEPIQWAVDAGIISGMKVNGVNCVNPKGTATRAQAARMLMQFDSISTEIE